MRQNSIQHLVDLVNNVVGKPTIEGMRRAAIEQLWTWEGPINYQRLGQTYEAHHSRVAAILAQMNNQTLGSIIGFGLDRSGDPAGWENNKVFIQVTSFTELAEPHDDSRLPGRDLLVTIAARVLICAAYDLALQSQFQKCVGVGKRAYAI